VDLKKYTYINFTKHSQHVRHYICHINQNHYVEQLFNLTIFSRMWDMYCNEEKILMGNNTKSTKSKSCLKEIIIN
jgi:hypothetical protein